MKLFTNYTFDFRVGTPIFNPPPSNPVTIPEFLCFNLALILPNKRNSIMFEEKIRRKIEIMHANETLVGLKVFC